MSASESETVVVEERECTHRGLLGVLDRTDGLTNVPAVWVAIGAVLLDRTVTLAFWSYEANPFVAEMSQLEWLTVTAILLAGMLVAWYPLEVRDVWVGRTLAVWIAVVHLAVVAINLWVVFG